MEACDAREAWGLEVVRELSRGSVSSKMESVPRRRWRLEWENGAAGVCLSAVWPWPPLLPSSPAAHAPWRWAQATDH